MAIGEIRTADNETILAQVQEVYSGDPSDRIRLRNLTADHFVTCWNICEEYGLEEIEKGLRALGWIRKNMTSLSNFLDGRDGPYSDDARNMRDFCKKG